MRSTTIYLPLVSLIPARNRHRVYVQVFDVLEAVAQIAEKRVVEVLEHAPLSNYIPDAL